MANAQSTSDTVVERVLELMGRDMTVKQLADRCAAAGPSTLTVQALYKLLGQRKSDSRKPRPVTVDELVTLANALDCTTGWLLGEHATPRGSVGPIQPDQVGPLIDALVLYRSTLDAGSVGDGGE